MSWSHHIKGPCSEVLEKLKAESDEVSAELKTTAPKERILHTLAIQATETLCHSTMAEEYVHVKLSGGLDGKRHHADIQVSTSDKKPAEVQVVTPEEEPEEEPVPKSAPTKTPPKKK